MRSWRMPAAVLAGLLALCLVNSTARGRLTDSWTAALDRVDGMAAREDWDGAAAALAETAADYEKWELYLRITTEHEVLDEAEGLFARAEALAKERDSVEFRSHVAQLRAQLMLLREMERVSLANIL